MIKKNDISGNAEYPGSLYPFLLEGVNLRGALLHGSRMVAEMRANHELGPLETLALGQGYLAAGLLTGNLKGRDRLALRVECLGPFAGISVETNAAGDVRGYLLKNPIDLEGGLPEDLSLASLWGSGTLTLTRFPEGAKTPFTGRVELEAGSLALDLARYYLRSEQTPTAFMLSVKFDRDGNLLGAGGLFLQTLPGADDKVLAEVEERLASLPSIGASFAEGISPETYIEDGFGRFFPRILESRRVEFFCPCTAGRFAGFLSSLPREDLEDLAANGPFPLRTTCHSCNSTYEFSREELREMLEKRKPISDS